MNREDTKNFGDIFREFYDVITDEIVASKQSTEQLIEQEKQDRLSSEDNIKKMSVSLTSADDSTTELLKSSESLSYAIDADTGLININLLKIGNYKSEYNTSAKNNILKSSVPQDLITNDTINRGFRVTVMQGANSKSWIQILFANDISSGNEPLIYIRDAYGSESTSSLIYSNWNRLAFGQNVDEKINREIAERTENEKNIRNLALALSDDEGKGVIPLNKNNAELAYALEPIEGKIFLDYLKPGNYRSTQASTARTNVHIDSVPSEILSSNGIDRGFRLTVMHGGNVNNWFQIMFCNDANSTNVPMIFIRDAYDTVNDIPSQYSKWQLLTIGGDSKIEKIEQIIKDQQSKIRGVQNRTMSLSVGLSHALIKNHVTDIWQPAEFDEIPDANELQEPGILYFKSNIKLYNNFPDNINLGGSYFINIGYKPKNTNSKQYASLVQIVLPLDGALWMRRRDMNTEYTNWINIAKGGIDETKLDWM